MASEGPNSPDLGEDDNTVGTTTWINPDRITIEDSSFASASIGFEP